MPDDIPANPNPAIFHPLAGIYGFETPEDDSVRIQKAIAALEPFGVSPKNFNSSTVINNCLTTNQFLKLSRTVLSHPDDVRSTLLDVGVKREYFKPPEEMDVSGFVKLCTFLKSKEGNEILVKIQKCLKLEKRVNRVREGFDVEIAKLESKIRKLEKKKDEINYELEHKLSEVW